MRNIYFYETREEAKEKAKELKKKKCRSVIITKEPKPYKSNDGRLLYYSVMWIFWYIKQKNLKKIKNMYWQWQWTRLLYNQDKRNKEKPKWQESTQENRQEKN